MELSSWVKEEKNRLNEFFTWWEEDVLNRENSVNVFSMDGSPISWTSQYGVWKKVNYLEEDRRIEDREIGVPANGLYGNSYQNRNVGEGGTHD